jgi:hypothetical protein
MRWGAFIMSVTRNCYSQLLCCLVVLLRRRNISYRRLIYRSLLTFT